MSRGGRGSLPRWSPSSCGRWCGGAWAASGARGPSPLRGQSHDRGGRSAMVEALLHRKPSQDKSSGPAVQMTRPAIAAWRGAQCTHACAGQPPLRIKRRQEFIYNVRIRLSESDTHTHTHNMRAPIRRSPRNPGSPMSAMTCEAVNPAQRGKWRNFESAYPQVKFRETWTKYGTIGGLPRNMPKPMQKQAQCECLAQIGH